MDKKDSLHWNSLLKLLGEGVSSKQIMLKFKEQGIEIKDYTISNHKNLAQEEIAIIRQAFLRTLPIISDLRWRIHQMQKLFDDVMNELWLEEPAVSKDGEINYTKKRGNHLVALKILEEVHRELADRGLDQDDEAVHTWTPEKQLNWIMTQDPEDETWKKDVPEADWRLLLEPENGKKNDKGGKK